MDCSDGFSRNRSNRRLGGGAGPPAAWPSRWRTLPLVDWPRPDWWDRGQLANGRRFPFDTGSVIGWLEP